MDRTGLTPDELDALLEAELVRGAALIAAAMSTMPGQIDTVIERAERFRQYIESGV